MAEANDPKLPRDTATTEDDKALRDEIIESQKIQADFLKWKLITVAGVAAAGLGIAVSNNAAGDGAKLLLCLVPLICSYVDLISLHIMIRIITIGSYLKLRGNPYELFVFRLRERLTTHPFVFESLALHGSSLIFNVIILALGIALPPGAHWDKNLLTAYVVAGGVGVVMTVFWYFTYTRRAREVSREAEKAFPASQADEVKHDEKKAVSANELHPPPSE